MAGTRAKTASAKRTANALGVADWQSGMETDRVLAIDPGAVNCGMAWFSLDQGTWQCEEAWKFGPYACLDWTEQRVGWDEPGLAVVIEEFRLYPGKAGEQGFSSMGTSQVIGALHWIIAKRNRRLEDLGLPIIPVRMQTASIRFHGCEVLGGDCERVKGKGIRHDEAVHIGKNVHARDAEAHGTFFIAKKVAAPEQMRLLGT